MTLNELAQLYNAVKAANAKQLAILNQIKTNDIDSAVKALYTKETMEQFISSTHIPAAQDATNFVQVKITQGAAQQFVHDMVDKLSHLGTDAKAALLNGVAEYYECPVSYENGKLKPHGNVAYAKSFTVDLFLRANAKDIASYDVFNSTMDDKVDPYKDNIEKWFVDQALVSPTTSTDVSGEM